MENVVEKENERLLVEAGKKINVSDYVMMTKLNECIQNSKFSVFDQYKKYK